MTDLAHAAAGVVLQDDVLALRVSLGDGNGSVGGPLVGRLSRNLASHHFH